MRTMFFVRFFVLLSCALGFLANTGRAYQSDNGDGTFSNPVLYADYPDPDIIRVSNDFYMVSTTFVDSPGVNVLHSKDLVNWEIASHLATNLDGGNAYDMNGKTAYRGGFWASTIQYYNGTFYVAANCTWTNSRIYYTTNAAGPWQYYQLDQVAYDAGLFIDTDGTGYLVAGHGPQSVFLLNSNYSKIVSVSKDILNSGGEGTHVVKRGNYYYFFNAKPTVWPFQLLCSRSTNIFGPYETNHVCLTETGGGHQGSIVDMPDGTDYGFVMKDGGGIGRMTYICPITWANGWPVWGASGQVPAKATKPIKGMPVMQPATSDEFTDSTLGLQWQWNHNPDNTRWSLTARSGYLRLMPTQAKNFWVARNTLTQKGQGPWSRGDVKLDVSHLQPGDVCGFGTFGLTNGQIAVTCDSGGSKYLSMNVIVPTDGTGTALYQTNYGRIPVTGNSVYLRTDLDFRSNLGMCSYSFDGVTWATLGVQFGLGFDISVSTFQGEKYAIFCYNPSPSAGYVDVDWFHFSDKIQRARPHLNAARTTFVGDNGQPLRGPYTSTEWTAASPSNQIANIKNLGFNAVHLYAESFDTNYPNTGSKAPGYSAAEVDKIVQYTRDSGLYLVITIGNGAYNGNYNLRWITDFWKFYAPRYANQTHVLYEIQNEPVAWGPPYLTSQNPPGAVNMEIAAYNTIRSLAPNTPVLLFSYSVIGDAGGTSSALTDIHAFNSSVFGTADAVWTNEAVAFHGYAGWKSVSTAVAGLINAGYPCFMTEFSGGRWGGGGGGFDVEMGVELERLGVSWLTFQYIPPSGVSDDVTKPERFKSPVDDAGLSWNPDYGNWPPPRKVFGNNGAAWPTPGFVNNFLSGTLRVEAENFDAGGNGVAYYNANSTLAALYRTNDTVGIATASDTGAGYCVTSTAGGDWLEYTIRVAAPGTYNLRLRVAGASDGSVQAFSCGTNLTGAWSWPSTGGSQSWKTITNTVFLPPGQQKLRIQILSGGFNLNWIELSPASTGPLANGTYKFLNCANGLTLQGVSSNSTVIATTYSGIKEQQWNVQHIGGGQYKITSVANNWSWNAFGDGLGFVWWWGTGADQCYLIQPAGAGYFKVLTVNQGVAIGTSASGPGAVSRSQYLGRAAQQWAIVSPTVLPFPTGLTAIAMSGTQVNLSWGAVSGATSYNVKRSATSGGPYTTIATVTTTNYVDTSTAGLKYYYVVSAVAGGVEGLNSGEATIGLPYPWTAQDIGSVGISGSANFSSGVFTAAVAGSDVWGTSDAFRFVYVPATGNCTIVARVTSVQNVDPWSKAGVMIRESLAANSSHAFMAISPGNGAAFQSRSSTGGSSANNNTTGYSAPYWVKLVRNANTFTGYRSPDGVTWTQQGTVTFTMATTAYIGLAVTSHNNSSLCTATFDNVSAPGWSSSNPPLAPAGLTATAGSSQATLTWTASTGATSYNIKRSTNNGGPYTVVANATTTQYTDTGLVNGTPYYYVVSALNSAGESANSSQVSATPQGNVPTGLGAVAASTNQINLSWIALANASSYNVKRSTVNGGPYTTIATGITVPNYSDTGLAGGTIYYYVVSAMIAGNETANSPQASATTQSPVIGSLVHRYNFNETAGTTVADSIGGPVWSGFLPSGGTLLGDRLTLSGSQYVSLPTGVVASLSNMTIIAWVNLASISDWSRIFDFGNDANTNMFLTPQCGGSQTLRFAITTSGAGGEQQINCNATLTTGTWHQLAVVLTTGTGILYLDGVAVGTNSAMTLTPASLGIMANNYIGKSQYADPYLNGSINQFRIYNTGLSAAEIAGTFALGPTQLLSTESPQLSATVNGNSLTFSWPLASAGFSLQSKTDLGSGDWADVTSPLPQMVNNQWQVTVPLARDAASVYFRLAK